MGSPRMIAECYVWCAGTSRASSALTVVLIPLITSFVRVVGEAAPVEAAQERGEAFTTTDYLARVRRMVEEIEDEMEPWED